jgi:hypothetical protein
MSNQSFYLLDDDVVWCGEHPVVKSMNIGWYVLHRSVKFVRTYVLIRINSFQSLSSHLLIISSPHQPFTSSSHPFTKRQLCCAVCLSMQHRSLLHYGTDGSDQPLPHFEAFAKKLEMFFVPLDATWFTLLACMCIDRWMIGWMHECVDA